jgi:type II secretory pathway pseudopilin PulG
VSTRRGRQRGMVYLLLLFALATLGFLLAEFGHSWSTTAQRDRETELLFIGQQFAKALASYGARSPQGTPAAPEKLEDLLEDRRFPFTVRHLRDIPRDPMTGLRDWEVVRIGGRIVAVHSQSTRQALREAGLPAWVTLPPDVTGTTSYDQWMFAAAAATNATTRSAQQ